MAGIYNLSFIATLLTLIKKLFNINAVIGKDFGLN